MDHFCESSPHFRKENHQGHGFCSDAMCCETDRILASPMGKKKRGDVFFLKKISAVKLKRLLS